MLRNVVTLSSNLHYDIMRFLDGLCITRILAIWVPLNCDFGWLCLNALKGICSTSIASSNICVESCCCGSMEDRDWFCASNALSSSARRIRESASTSSHFGRRNRLVCLEKISIAVRWVTIFTHLESQTSYFKQILMWKAVRQAQRRLTGSAYFITCRGGRITLWIVWMKNVFSHKGCRSEMDSAFFLRRFVEPTRSYDYGVFQT